MANPNLRPVTDTPPRAIIYLRQSTHRDDSVSLELQELACRDYCDRMGYTVTTVRADPGISGRTWSKRPEVQKTMHAIETGAADVIVLWKWSRLSRSRKDWALAADRVDVAGGRIESATEPIDTATASGRFARGVMTEYAAFQSEQIGETWEEVRQRRLRLGLPASGRLPFGWVWVKGAGIEPNPDHAPIVAEMYRRYLSGDGASTIAQWLNSARVPGPNGNPWTRVRPLTVMDSPIHAGLIPYRGNTYPGAHTPIITADTWSAYQAERARRRTTGTKPRNYDHLLSSLVRCECGARMSGKGSITGGKWYGGYICAEKTEHPQRAYVSAKILDPVITRWAMVFDVEGAAAPEQPGTAAKRARLLREQTELENELAGLARQNARGIITDARYLRAVADVETELRPIVDGLRALDNATRGRPDPAAVYQMRGDWQWWTVPERNKALRKLIERIELVGDRARIVTTWGHSSVLPF